MVSPGPALHEVSNPRCIILRAAQVNTTFRRYPLPQQLEAVEPDFLYGSYASAFTVQYINYTAWANIDACTLSDSTSSKFVQSSDGGGYSQARRG